MRHYLSTLGYILLGIAISLAVDYAFTGSLVCSRPQADIPPFSSQPSKEIDTPAYLRIQALATTLEAEDPITSANLLVVGASTVLGDQVRLGQLMRRYNQLVLEEIQARKHRDE